LDGGGDGTAVLARAHPDASWTDADGHIRISSIAMHIAVMFATNLHVDAGLSYL
jgi:hypothetical protein